MSFTWTSITAGTTKTTAALMNEVKTNVDHLTTQLGVAAYSWSTLPVSQYAKAMATNLTELQNAITYVDGLNTCVTNNATANSSALTGDDNSIHTGKDATIYSGQDTGIHTGKDATIYSGQDAGIHTGKDSSVQSSQNSYYLNDHNGSLLSSQNTYYLNDHNTTVNVGQYSTVYNPANSYNLATHWTSAQNGANGTVNSTY